MTHLLDLLGIQGTLRGSHPLVYLAGLGFGGQINYWGLYVDGQCDGGMSRDCSTFKRWACCTNTQASSV